MKTLITKILIGLAVLIVILLIVVIALQPADYRVERSATMAATPAVLFDQVNDHHKFAAWNPFCPDEIGATLGNRGETQIISKRLWPGLVTGSRR